MDCIHDRYPIVARTWPFGRVRARAKVYCILVCKIPLLARRTRPMQPAGQARRATIGYLVYKLYTSKWNACKVRYDLYR